MYIKKVEIENFRQLNSISLDLDKKMSVLAGPNNSGKTSLILLLKRVLSDNDFGLKSNDFNIYEQAKWVKIFSDRLLNCKLENSIEAENLFLDIDDSDNSLLLPEIEVKLQIDYEDNDDLTDFSQYLLDLDEKRHSFYFKYKISLEISKFINSLQENNLIISKAIEDSGQSVGSKETSKNNSKLISKILMKLYCDNCVSHIYYCNKTYETAVEIKHQRNFHNLFHFMYIPAARLMEDLNSKNRALSNGLISFAQSDDNWNQLINDISQSLYGTINENIVDVSNKSSDSLKKILDAVSNSNGGNLGNIALDVDVNEEDVQQLVSGTTHAQYTVKGTGASKDLEYILNETSQGLGYSNLVYLDTQIETFIREIEMNRNKVSFVVIEEPESHMHPQMQYVFARQLIQKYNDSNLQGLITTHSTEIVRGVDIDCLRVLREETRFNCKLFNLDEMFFEENNLNADGGMDDKSKSFYKLVGISNLIFADRAILFEGDTERLYIKQLINNEDEFEGLRNKYVAYIQVGGSYAFKFEKILKMLGIKSLIITDADYEKGAANLDDLFDERCTTNGTIKYFYKKTTGKDSNKVLLKDIYDWLDPIDTSDKYETKGKIVYTNEVVKLNGEKDPKDLILLTCQSKADQYTRTLEAAMLTKLFGLSPFQQFSRNELKQLKNEYKLQFSVPQEKEGNYKFSLIDVLNSTANNKTDFMYSVIMNNLVDKMIPHYIEEGLKWLQK